MTNKLYTVHVSFDSFEEAMVKQISIYDSINDILDKEFEENVSKRYIDNTTISYKNIPNGNTNEFKYILTLNIKDI